MAVSFAAATGLCPEAADYGVALGRLDDQCFIRAMGALAAQDDARATRTILEVKRFGTERNEQTMILARSAKDPDDVPQGVDMGLLPHEIIRHAIFDALHDGLGLVVRDETLGESLSGGTTVATFEIASLFPAKQSGIAAICRLREETREVLWAGEVLLNPAETADDSERLAARIDALASSEIRPALLKAGLGRAPGVGDRLAEVPERIEEQLQQLDIFSQFNAIRRLNAIRSGARPSHEWLGAAARAYANLGVLTEFHWSSAHKAMKARALLEAQRWVTAEPRSPRALWHHAYVLALLGMHKEALDDLVSARERLAELQDRGQAPARPNWVELIEAYCRFDLKALDAVPDGQLRRMLALFAVEMSPGTARKLAAARALLKANPECYRALDTMWESAALPTCTLRLLKGWRLSRELYACVWQN